MGNIYSEIVWPFKYLIDSGRREFSMKYIKENSINDAADYLQRYEKINKENAIVSRFLILVFCNELIRKNVLNVFVETNELYDFLKNTRVVESDIISRFFEDNSKYHGKIKVSQSMEINTLGILIHHPLKNKEHSIIYSIADYGGGYFDYSIVTEKGTHEVTNVTNLDNINKSESMRILFNFIYYIYTFNDCFIDGVPWGVKNKNHYKCSGNRILKTHYSIVDNNGVIPHYRSGYFKTLTSQRFKKMRFKTIFVKSTFVGGKAKTAIENRIVN